MAVDRAGFVPYVCNYFQGLEKRGEASGYCGCSRTATPTRGETLNLFCDEGTTLWTCWQLKKKNYKVNLIRMRL